MRVNLVNALALKLEPEGYRMVSSAVIKAPSRSHEIENLVYFRSVKGAGSSILVEIGIRHDSAQKFAVSALQLYGRPPLNRLINFSETGSAIRFPIGLLLDWSPPWTVSPARVGEERAEQIIFEGIMRYHHSMIDYLSSESALLDFLVEDRFDKIRLVNPAVRLAMSVHLARRVGRNLNELLRGARLESLAVRSQISAECDLEKYIDHLVKSEISTCEFPCKTDPGSGISR